MQGFYIIIMIIALRHGEVSCSTEEGPYEAIVSNISSCVVEQVSWYRTNISTYNVNGRNLLRGNFVTKRDFRNAKFSVRLNYIDQGKQVKAFEVKNQNCRNLIVQVVMNAIGLQYNSRTCLLKPTIWEFSNVDVNAIIHKVVNSLWYGFVQIHFEIAKSTTPVMCVDINVEIKKVEN